MINTRFKRESDRWYPLIDIPEQVRLRDETVRFKAIPAGRRSGKTERFKRKVAKEAMKNPGELYFMGAPTHGQAKKIFWDDIKLLTFSSTHVKKPSESELKIFLPNETQIHLIGLDQPARIEGIPWTGGGIDEIADCKENTWEEHVLPSLIPSIRYDLIIEHGVGC